MGSTSSNATQNESHNDIFSQVILGQAKLFVEVGIGIDVHTYYIRRTLVLLLATTT